MRSHFGSPPFFSLVTIILLSGLSILARSQKPGTSGGGPSIAEQFNQHFDELKQDKAKIEQAAQSPNISREQKDRATNSVAELDNLITVAEALLKDPALKASPEKQEKTYACVQSAIAYGNAIVLSTRTGLNGAPLNTIETTVASHFQDHMVKVSPRFDGSTTNPNDVGGPNGTPFLGLRGDHFAIVSVNAVYTPPTLQAAQHEVRMYGSVGGTLSPLIRAEALKSKALEQ
jgi:hypothetical protein